MRHGTNDLASEIECASSGAISSSSKVNDCEASIIKPNTSKEVDLAYVLKSASNDIDDDVAMPLVHAFFPENVDDDLRAVVKSNTQSTMLGKENGTMSWVNGASTNRSQER